MTAFLARLCELVTSEGTRMVGLQISGLSNDSNNYGNRDPEDGHR